MLRTFVAIKIKFGSAITNLPKSIEFTVDLVNLFGFGWKCFVKALLEGGGLQFGRISRV